KTQSDLPDHRIPGKQGETDQGPTQEPVRRDVAADRSPQGAVLVRRSRVRRPHRVGTTDPLLGNRHYVFFARILLALPSASLSSLEMSASLRVRTADIATSRTAYSSWAFGGSSLLVMLDWAATYGVKWSTGTVAYCLRRSVICLPGAESPYRSGIGSP